MKAMKNLLKRFWKWLTVTACATCEHAVDGGPAAARICTSCHDARTLIYDDAGWMC